MPHVHYILNIRNKKKRAYAEALGRWYVNGGELPGRPLGMTPMVAQAVEMRLAQLLGPTSKGAS